MSYHWHDDEYGWCPCDEPPCEDCHGSGWVRKLTHTLNVQNAPLSPCPACSVAAISDPGGTQ